MGLGGLVEGVHVGDPGLHGAAEGRGGEDFDHGADLEEFHDEVVGGGEVEFKVGVVAVVFDEALAVVKREGFEVGGVVGGDANYYAFGFRVLANDDAKVVGEIVCGGEVFG